MIRVSHLTKRYGAHVAVDDVSFAIAKGEVVGFLGPNGAGKTTTLRILAGVLGPSAGTVAVADHDIAHDSLEARRSIGYMPESVPLYPEMRVVEYLHFRAELKRVPRTLRRGHVEEAMTKAGVIDVAHKRIAFLSKGYRQRVGMADAIVAKPPIVILDEPTAGLDPNQIRDTRALIRELGRDSAVVVSTHVLSEVEACASRVLLLHRGKLVAEGPTAAIRSMRSGAAVDLIVRGDASDAARVLLPIDGVAAVEPTSSHPSVDTSGNVLRLRVSFAPDLPGSARDGVTEDIVAALVRAGLHVRDVRAADGSLEDVFAALTQNAAPLGGDSTARPEGR